MLVLKGQINACSTDVLRVQFDIMNTEFKKYLDKIGGASQAAAHLGCSLSTVYKVLKCERPLKPEYAGKICEQYKELSFSALLLPEKSAA